MAVRCWECGDRRETKAAVRALVAAVAMAVVAMAAVALVMTAVVTTAAAVLPVERAALVTAVAAALKLTAEPAGHLSVCNSCPVCIVLTGDGVR